jgi:hypothetical protein
MELARIGATPKGGVKRLALTDLDKQGRDLVVSWGKEAGLSSPSTRSATSSCAAKAATRRCRPWCRAATSTRSRPAASSTATTACWRRWKWCAR